MLLLFTSFAELDLEQLLRVYEGSVNVTSISACRAFYEDLETFFDEGGTLAVWMHDGRYAAALRFECYTDGYLISCLETKPGLRRHGYATALLRQMLEMADGPVYAHVEKCNTASVSLHKQCGFTIVKDYAVYVDGSVYRSSCTMRRDP